MRHGCARVPGSLCGQQKSSHQAVHMGARQVACEFFSLLETEEVFLEVAERFASGFKQFPNILIAP